MRLRPGPIASRNNTIYFVVFLTTNRGSLLPYIHVRKDDHYISQSGVRHFAGLPEPLPSFCVNASSEGFEASSWSVLRLQS